MYTAIFAVNLSIRLTRPTKPTARQSRPLFVKGVTLYRVAVIIVGGLRARTLRRECLAFVTAIAQEKDYESIVRIEKTISLVNVTAVLVRESRH